MTVDIQNGHHPAGRAAPEAPTYTFPGGQVATLHAVSQFTQAAIEIGIRKAYPPPSPPLNEVRNTAISETGSKPVSAH